MERLNSTPDGEKSVRNWITTTDGGGAEEGVRRGQVLQVLTNQSTVFYLWTNQRSTYKYYSVRDERYPDRYKADITFERLQALDKDANAQHTLKVILYLDQILYGGRQT